MTDLECAIGGCDSSAVTIWRGYALCRECWELSDEIPEYVPSRHIEGILMEMQDENITGNVSLKAALDRRGLGR